MQKVLLLYQTEGGSVLRRDMTGFDMDVEAVNLQDAETAMLDPDDRPAWSSRLRAIWTRRGTCSSRRPGLRGRRWCSSLATSNCPASTPTWPVDDFVVLPTAADELALRLRRAIWRKTGRRQRQRRCASGELMLDLANYKVFVAEQPVNLTFKEFELLRFLMTNRGKVFTREALLNRVWGYEYFGGARTVDVHIRRLRSKIETGSTIYIETVRNVGYRFPME